MNANPSNRTLVSEYSRRRGLPCCLGLVMALMAFGLPVSPARADNTYAQADIKFWIDVNCDIINCPSASGLVVLGAACDKDGSCTGRATYSFYVPCHPFPKDPVSLKLHLVQVNACGGGLWEKDIKQPFPLTLAEWNTVRAGGGFIVADLGALTAGGTARGSGSTSKASGKDIPTLSEWAVVLMTLSLIVAGTILFGRVKSPAQAT